MKKNLFHNIYYAISGTWKNEKRVILLTILQIITGIVVPMIGVLLPSVVVEGIGSGLEFNSLILRVMLILILLLLSNVANTYISSVYETYLLNNKIGFLSELFRKRMELNYAFVESPKGQNMYQCALTTLLNDSKGISGMMHVIGPAVGSLINLILYVGLVVGFDYRIVLVLAITSALHLFAAVRIMGKQHMLKEPVNDLDRKMNYLFRFVSEEKGNKDIKIFSMQEWLRTIADKLVGERAAWTKKIAEYNFLLAVSDTVLLAARDIFAYFAIFQAVYSGRIEIWQFVFYFGIITSVSVFVTNLTNYAAQIGQKSREIADLREFMGKEDMEDGEELEWMDSVCIQLLDVSFRFNDESPYILKHVSLELHENEKIALVGENGAGKTTLVKLICGFYKPTDGRVLINGIDVEKIKQSSLRKLFAAVFQDIHILPMTIGENIAFQDAGEYREEVRSCIEMAGLKGEFLDTEKPLTKMLHPEGLVPSGGQAQKIILARAAFKLLHRNAKILILDEPTAALDAISEKAFYESYQQTAQGKSCIFISHRLASTQFCDRIIVLEQGKIIENGTHGELMKQDTKYRELYEIQSRYYK